MAKLQNVTFEIPIYHGAMLEGDAVYSPVSYHNTRKRQCKKKLF